MIRNRFIGYLLFLVGGLAASPAGRAQEAALQPAPIAAISLSEAVERVLIHNETLQSKLLDAEIARRQYKAEKGIFEPAVVGSAELVDNNRENTTEQARNLFGAPTFSERNQLYNGGLEFLSPIGSRLRLGYNVRRLDNSLQAATNQEFVTTIGFTMTQPLLKNFGTGATLARIRLAAINSDMAFQEYRRQLMLTVSRAEAAYWDLYLTQEQDRITQDSLQQAESILKDNKARLDVGKSSELEVMQAEAGLSLRQARRSEAGQKLAEAANQLSTLFSGASYGTNPPVRAAEEPSLREVNLDFFQGYKNAFDRNPDYLSRKHAAIAENVRLAFSKNQLLPQLDLKSSFGLNGLGPTVNSSWRDIESRDFPSWSVGVELRIPLTGGIKERNEYKAAQLAKQKSLVGLKEIEVQIGNALNTSMMKVRNLRSTVDNHRSVITFHEQLLKTQLARLEVGVIDSRTVLETEEKLFEARTAMIDAMVAYQKGMIELELVQGMVLANRQLDLTKSELQRMTDRMIAANRFGGPELDNLKREIQSEYENRIGHLDAWEKPQSFGRSIFE